MDKELFKSINNKGVVKAASTTLSSDPIMMLGQLAQQVNTSLAAALNAQIQVIQYASSPELYASSFDLLLKNTRIAIENAPNEMIREEISQRTSLMLNNFIFFMRAKIEYRVRANREEGERLLTNAVDTLGQSVTAVVKLAVGHQTGNGILVASSMSELTEKLMPNEKDSFLKKAFRWLTESSQLAEELSKFHLSLQKLFDKLEKAREYIGPSDIIAGLIENYAKPVADEVYSEQINARKKDLNAAKTSGAYNWDGFLGWLMGTNFVVFVAQIIVLLVRWIISWFSDDMPEHWAKSQWIWCGVIDVVICVIITITYYFKYTSACKEVEEATDALDLICRERNNLYNSYMSLSKEYKE